MIEVGVESGKKLYGRSSRGLIIDAFKRAMRIFTPGKIQR